MDEAQENAKEIMDQTSELSQKLASQASQLKEEWSESASMENLETASSLLLSHMGIGVPEEDVSKSDRTKKGFKVSSFLPFPFSFYLMPLLCCF